jgi:hypothetical protein
MSKKAICVLLSLIITISGAIYYPVYAGTNTIDQYITINRWWKSSTGEIKVNYTVKQNITNQYYNFKIGYTWPAVYRNSVSGHMVDVNRTKGTYTLTLKKPANVIGKLNLHVSLDAYRYSEEKHISYIFNAPSTVDVEYHTVTAAEAGGAYIIYNAVPAIALELSPATKTIKWLGRIYSGWSLYSGFKDSVGLGSGFPFPKAGQYYRITTWYEDYQCKVRTEVWDSKAAFNARLKPIYNGVYSTDFDF